MRLTTHPAPSSTILTVRHGQDNLHPFHRRRPGLSATREPGCIIIWTPHWQDDGEPRVSITWLYRRACVLYSIVNREQFPECRHSVVSFPIHLTALWHNKFQMSSLPAQSSFNPCAFCQPKNNPVPHTEPHGRPHAGKTDALFYLLEISKGPTVVVQERKEWEVEVEISKKVEISRGVLSDQLGFCNVKVWLNYSLWIAYLLSIP